MHGSMNPGEVGGGVRGQGGPGADAEAAVWGAGRLRGALHAGLPPRNGPRGGVSQAPRKSTYLTPSPPLTYLPCLLLVDI